MRIAWLFALAALTAAAPAPAKGKDGPDYLGAWVITGSVPAPWIKSTAELFNDERATLIGKHIRFERNRIAAPAPMACRGPHYGIRRYPADMLFQGTLTDPARQAAKLGFPAGPVRTLETGCEGPLDYHFVDTKTAKFALNNAIYTVKRAD